MYTILAVYYVTRAGMNPLQLVLVGTVLEATVLLCEVPTGVVADTFSRRLSVVVGMFVLGAAWLLEGSVPLFAVILLAEVIRGLGETFLSGATDAWLAGEVGEEQVGRVYLRSGQINRVVGLAGTAGSVALASIQLNLAVLAGGVLYLALGVCLALVMPERGFSRPAPDARTGLDTVKAAERTAWQTMGQTFRQGTQVVRRSSALLSLFAVSAITAQPARASTPVGGAPADEHRLPVAGRAETGRLVRHHPGQQRPLQPGHDRAFSPPAGSDEPPPRRHGAGAPVLEALSVASVIAFGLAGNFGLALAALLIGAGVQALAGPLYNAWLIQNIDPEVRATVLSMLSQSNAFGRSSAAPAWA